MSNIQITDISEIEKRGKKIIKEYTGRFHKSEVSKFLGKGITLWNFLTLGTKRRWSERESKSYTKGQESEWLRTSTATLGARRQQSNAFTILRENDLPARTMHLLSYSISCRWKTFPNILYLFSRSYRRIKWESKTKKFKARITKKTHKQTNKQKQTEYTI